eukprot:14612655-Ditylum_brightwellii.AAC.1
MLADSCHCHMVLFVSGVAIIALEWPVFLKNALFYIATLALIQHPYVDWRLIVNFCKSIPIPLATDTLCYFVGGAMLIVFM